MTKKLTCPEGHSWSVDEAPGAEPQSCPSCGAVGHDDWSTATPSDQIGAAPTSPREVPSAVGRIAANLAQAAARQGVPPVIPGYEILEKIGQGGMGVVFKARHVALDRIVVLKVISSALLADPLAVERFRREARAAARLSHVNLVAVHDAGTAGDVHFLVMEFVEGMNLAQLVTQRGPLQPGEACEYIRQAALGLQHAHERKLVHRDIKPSNLLVTPQGTVKVVDLGLARSLTGPEGVAAEGTLTQQGGFMGTPDYVAPEQALDPHNADIRADIYSLGCTLYHCLSGGPPFPGGSFTQKLLRHQQEEPPPVGTPQVMNVIRKMTAKKAADRYQTPLAVAEALANPAWPATGPSSGEKQDGAATCLRSAQSSASHSSRNWWLSAGIVAGLGLGVVTLCWSLGLFSTTPPPQGDPKIAPNIPAQEAFTNSVGMRLILIPSGKFWMGASNEEFKFVGFENERPRRLVEITRAFYMGIHEVTQGQYEAVTDQAPSTFGPEQGCTPNYPVELVSWHDAVAFCVKLSALPAEKAKGRTYRLPSEAQWEYACRAQLTTPFAFGSTLDSSQANFDGRKPYPDLLKAKLGKKLQQTAAVGSYLHNAFGLFDMHGNVCEWCADNFENSYYQVGPDRDPPGPEKSEYRAVRGGGWESHGFDCRSASRGTFSPTDRHSSLGFRVICLISDKN